MASMTLPREYFASADLFAQELDCVFGREWLYIGRSERIAEPGQFFLFNIGAESVIVLRDHQGQVQAFYNVCRHRGTRLCAEERGRLRKTIQCPYHAWTYGLDGRLLGVPSLERMEGFAKEDYPLHNVAITEWAGSLYINLSPKAEPFEAVMGDSLDFFQPWLLDELVIVESTTYDVQANWKIILQNFSECYHCPTVHPEYSQVSHFESGKLVFNGDQLFGGTMVISEPGGGVSMSGRMCAMPFPAITGQARQDVHFYSMFPNMLMILAPDHASFYSLVPQTYDRTLIHVDWLFHRSAVLRPNFDAQDTVEIWDITNRQDWPLCELTQQGVQSRAYQPSPYYDYQEYVLAALDKRVLKALGRGG